MSKWIYKRFSKPVSLESVEAIAINDENELEDYEIVIVIGMGDEPLELPYKITEKLWNYVEKGGTLYGENIACYDFTTSRLFGFQQDYPKNIRSYEKLRISNSFLNDKSGNLLEWEGSYQKGFNISSDVWMWLGAYMQTHFAEGPIHKEYPALIYQKMGKGKTLYAAFSLIAKEYKTAYRPNWLWEIFLKKIEERFGIPFKTESKCTPKSKRSPKCTLDEAGNWFLKSGILPEQDGSKGVYENVHSLLMKVSKDHRPDCHAHTALMFYLYSKYTRNPEWENRAHSLMDYLIKEGYQDTDSNSATYGFWKWYGFPGAFPKQIFTDDNSWVCFVLLYLYRQTGKEIYKERGLLTAKALLRTQHDNGLRPEQIQGDLLQKEGIEQAQQEPVSMNPHFESMAHVAFLQAYQVTNEEIYLETAYLGTKYLLEHQDKMKWMYSLTSAYTRFLLAISILLRYKSDPQLKEGLSSIITYLRGKQHKSGGVEEADNPDPERYGEEDTGVYLQNGEGIADLLYTNNFLLMNLWETWKVTKEKEYYNFYQDLLNFITSVQIESDDNRFNGGWMRAYDLENQEYFGNNGDTGWGPYCIEGGWTTAIISVGILIGKLDISLFD